MLGVKTTYSQSFFSQQLDSRCFCGASNVRPWWTRSRQVVLLTVNLVAVCSSVNTQIHATYVDPSVQPLLMIYALSLQWLKSKHWQERTANSFVMASWLNLTKSLFFLLRTPQWRAILAFRNFIISACTKNAVRFVLQRILHASTTTKQMHSASAVPGETPVIIRRVLWWLRTVVYQFLVCTFVVSIRGKSRMIVKNFSKKKGQKPQQAPFSILHSSSLTHKFATTPQRTLEASNLPLLFT